MIQCNDITLTLAGKDCLSAITLHIKDSGITCIVGANGAGKTLLLKLFAGLYTTVSGNIQRNVSVNPQVTLVPQKPILLDRTVAENIAIPLRYSNTFVNGAIQKQVNAALAWADIINLADEHIARLSSGQQQLVALARAWALSPALLLLDEPTANLDPQRQQHIETLIQILSDQGCKIIISSHNIQQVERLAEDIVVLERGKVLSHTPADVFFTHHTRDVNQALFTDY